MNFHRTKLPSKLKLSLVHHPPNKIKINLLNSILLCSHTSRIYSIHNKKAIYLFSLSNIIHKRAFSLIHSSNILIFNHTQQSAFYTERENARWKFPRVKYLSKSHEFLCKINSIICLLREWERDVRKWGNARYGKEKFFKSP